MIYLFAGKRRHSDIGSILQRSADSGKIKLSLLEFDIERSPDHDLSSEHLWTQIHDLLKEGYILIVSPPCNTFSRARFQWQRHPGPRPLRNVNWPKGFPWLSAKNKSIVEEANSFILRCVEACIQCHSFGGKFLWEHPEDLGSVNGEFPASIWQWSEVRDLLVRTNAATFAIPQCLFGASTPKPTRFLTTLPVSDSRCHFGWPQFSGNSYVGPLPKSCGHIHDRKLIGQTDGKWNTGPSAAYPAGLCQFIADVCLVASRSFGRGKDDNNSLVTKNAVPKPVSSDGDVGGATHDATPDPGSCLDGAPGSTPHSSDEHGFDLGACGNGDHPIRVEWDGKERDFVDGFGLCSPTRWHPWNRGSNRPGHSLSLAVKTFNILEKAVVDSLKDPRAMAFKLVTGKLTESPFAPAVLEHCRGSLAHLLKASDHCLVADKGQPFYLRLLAAWLREFGDPDVSVLVDDEFSFSSGVFVGEDRPLPRTPQVFPPKEKHKKLDDSDFNPIADNYVSAQLSAAELESTGPPHTTPPASSWHQHSQGATGSNEPMEDSDSTEVKYKIRQWSLPGATVVPVLNVSSRVFWLELDDKALLDSYGVLQEGILCDVFSQKCSAAWQGARGERLTVSVMLPGRQDADDWLNFMLSQKNLWPTFTTRGTIAEELSAQVFSKERRRLQAHHLWMVVNLKWGGVSGPNVRQSTHWEIERRLGDSAL